MSRNGALLVSDSVTEAQVQAAVDKLGHPPGTVVHVESFDDEPSPNIAVTIFGKNGYLHEAGYKARLRAELGAQVVDYDELQQIEEKQKRGA